LHKLENGGWIGAEWRQSENNRRAKYYSLTKLGQKALRRETDDWNRLSNAITKIIQLSEA
jgi:DNA-binding PadR family transcriptional regulator